MPRKLTFAAALLVAAAPAAAQFGNGCNGDLVTTPFHSGSNFTLTVKGAPNADYVLLYSATAGPTTVPGLGVFSVGFDVFNPLPSILSFGALNGAGEAPFSFFVPNDPFWNSVVVYGQALVLDLGCPTFYAISPAVRFDWEAPDTFTAMPPMSAARALATADALPDGRVFVAGGGNGTLTGPVGTDTTELYSPFTRTWAAGPTLAAQRAFHQSAVLADGRVLLIGGTDGVGIVTTTCEFFDPATGTVSPAASMNQPRAGCTATRLSNGKVLVTGGVTTFQIPAGTTSIAPILATCRSDGELYDPVLNTWTAVPGAMASARFAHAATTLQNGKVLIVSGISGSTNLLGQDVPTFAQSCNLYNPTTNAWEAAAQLPPGFLGIGGIPGRAGHRLTTMNNNEVFMGGGVISSLGIPTATGGCARYTPASNSWTATNALGTPIALHGQVLLKNGKCHLTGGGTGTLLAFSATAACATRTQGSNAFTVTTPLPAARGSHLAVLLRDGSVLIAGGADAAGNAVGTVELYTPAP